MGSSSDSSSLASLKSKILVYCLSYGFAAVALQACSVAWSQPTVYSTSASSCLTPHALTTHLGTFRCLNSRPIFRRKMLRCTAVSAAHLPLSVSVKPHVAPMTPACSARTFFMNAGAHARFFCSSCNAVSKPLLACAKIFKAFLSVPISALLSSWVGVLKELLKIARRFAWLSPRGRDFVCVSFSPAVSSPASSLGEGASFPTSFLGMALPEKRAT